MEENINHAKFLQNEHPENIPEILIIEAEKKLFSHELIGWQSLEDMLANNYNITETSPPEATPKNEKDIKLSHISYLISRLNTAKNKVFYNITILRDLLEKIHEEENPEQHEHVQTNLYRALEGLGTLEATINMLEKTKKISRNIEENTRKQRFNEVTNTIIEEWNNKTTEIEDMEMTLHKQIEQIINSLTTKFKGHEQAYFNNHFTQTNTTNTENITFANNFWDSKRFGETVRSGYENMEQFLSNFIRTLRTLEGKRGEIKNILIKIKEGSNSKKENLRKICTTLENNGTVDKLNNIHTKIETLLEQLQPYTTLAFSAQYLNHPRKRGKADTTRYGVAGFSLRTLRKKIYPIFNIIEISETSMLQGTIMKRNGDTQKINAVIPPNTTPLQLAMQIGGPYAKVQS